MCQDALRMPFTAGHICEAIQRLYPGKLAFHERCAQISEGVTVRRIGGHSRGLQAIRVQTKAGWLVLASNAAHFYENLTVRKPFPIVVDLEDMPVGFDTLERLASSPGLIIPGDGPFPTSHGPAYRTA